jgi:DNA-binding IclR family transcriptional regulator
MKTLDKVFGIMEMVADQGGAPLTPGRAAEALGLNPATCVRFMKYLCERGYLEQVSRQAGYVAGPAGLTFADRQSKYSRLISASEMPVKNLANSLNTYINISILYNSMRYLLYSYSSHTWQTSGARRLAISYDVATSRLLLSACPVDERNALINQLGVPGPEWTEVNDMPTLITHLDKMKQARCISFADYLSGQIIVGGLIEGKNVPAAAIGYGIAGNDATEAIELTLKAVRQIEENLDSNPIYF